LASDPLAFRPGLRAAAIFDRSLRGSYQLQPLALMWQATLANESLKSQC